MLVARFEADGLIRRSRSVKDQRAWCLFLTDKGTELARAAFAIQTEITEVMAHPFSDAELSRIKSQMEAASASLSRMREQAAKKSEFGA